MADDFLLYTQFAVIGGLFLALIWFGFSRYQRQTASQPKSDDATRQQNQTTRSALLNTLPAAGEYCAFEGFDACKEEAKAKFVFSSASLFEHLDKSVLYDYLAKRDDTLSLCTLIPPEMSDIRHKLFNMLEQGHGQAYCYHCQKSYQAEQLVTHVEGFESLGGWTFKVVNCPEQHLLMREEYIHFLVARPST